MDPSIQPLDDYEQKKMKADATGEPPMETVGVYLKKERESKNLSLREVARLTKISELYLDCIEKDDYDKIPKGPYVKGYISSYSRMIGGDTQQALKLYASINQKEDQADETTPAMPPPKGWKASMATALSSIVESFRKIKIRRHGDLAQSLETGLPAPPATSLLEKRKASRDAARPPETEGRFIDSASDKAESSVLIPFKKFAPLSQADDSIDEPVPPVKTTQAERMSVKSDILSIHQKLVAHLGAVGQWSSALLSKVAANRWPVRPRTLLLAVGILLVGGAILIFCGFGVYHIFFFDKPSPITTETKALSGGDSATAAPDTSPLTVPHKTIRFKKPDSPPPAAVVADTPKPAESVVDTPKPAAPPTPAAPAPTAARPAPDRRRPATEEIPATAADSAVESPQPVGARVRVLKATICSTIKERMPADIATTFPLSVERVYVWSHVQAEQYPTAIQHIYYHEGKMVNRVELSIRSPFWRTWSFKSIDKDRYRGHWRVDIASIDGTVLRRLYFEIN